jgi:CBS domain-containing protein
MKREELIQKETERCLINADEFFELKIKDVMKRRAWDIPLIKKEREIIHVFALLNTNDHVWVVDSLKTKRIIGIITEHDILHALKPTKTHRFFGMPSRKGLGLSLFETAEHIMTHDPFFCTPDDKVLDILHTLEAHGIRRVPVIDPITEEILSEITIHQLIKRYYEIIEPLCSLDD